MFTLGEDIDCQSTDLRLTIWFALRPEANETGFLEKDIQLHLQ